MIPQVREKEVQERTAARQVRSLQVGEEEDDFVTLQTPRSLELDQNVQTLVVQERDQETQTDTTRSLGDQTKAANDRNT